MSTTGTPISPLRSRAYLVVLGVLCASALGIGAAINALKFNLTKLAIYPPDGRKVAQLMRESESWIAIGVDRRESIEVEAELGTDNYVTRTYVRKTQEGARRDKPEAIELHAAYYTGMVDTVPHVPDRCFVGGGIEIQGIIGDLRLSSDPSSWLPHEGVENARERGFYTARLGRYSSKDGQRITLPRHPDRIDMKTMKFPGGKDGEPMFVGYFFVANGGTVASADQVRLLAFDLKAKYAYYLKVEFHSTSYSTAEEFVQGCSSLWAELGPDLLLAVPDWVEVEAGNYPLPKS